MTGRLLASTMLSTAVGLGIAAGQPVARAATIQGTPESYLPLVRALKPGDRLLLAPGEYAQGLALHGLQGTREAPIRIGALDPAKRPRFVGRPGHNTVSIVDAAFVEVANLDLDGRGLPVNGVKAEGHARYAHHVVVRGLRIVGHGANQNVVGISTKCPAWGWVIRDNLIVGAGTGMYLGDSDGSAPFVAGLIEGNVVLDTIGYNVQIKHQKARPFLPGMPDGASVTVIRRNVFRKGANSSHGELARPNLLVGHFPPQGPGADDTYLVYGNFLYRNATEALFQGEGNVALYNNAFVNPEGSAVRVQPHNAVPERIDIFHNTVVARDNGIRVTGGNPARAQRVFGNVVFAAQPLAGGLQTGNVSGELAQAPAVLRAPLDEPKRLDLRPQPGVLAPLPPGSPDTAAFPQAGLDFDRVRRVRPLPGAFGEEDRAFLPLATPRRPAVTARVVQ